MLHESRVEALRPGRYKGGASARTSPFAMCAMNQYQSVFLVRASYLAGSMPMRTFWPPCAKRATGSGGPSPTISVTALLCSAAHSLCSARQVLCGVYKAVLFKVSEFLESQTGSACDRHACSLEAQQQHVSKRGVELVHSAPPAHDVLEL